MSLRYQLLDELILKPEQMRILFSFFLLRISETFTTHLFFFFESIPLFCDLQFQVKKHVRSFHSEKIYQCTECDKAFCRPDKLRLHMLRHSDRKDFLCSTCGKQFKVRWVLTGSFLIQVEVIVLYLPSSRYSRTQRRKEGTCISTLGLSVSCKHCFV